jgi:hypothetical protein
MKRLTSCLAVATALFVAVPVTSAIAGELDGSRKTLRRVHRVATREEYKFLRTTADVRAFVKRAKLVRLSSNADYVVNDVMFPYARPAVKLFVDRLAAQYRAATGDRLVITSLTRPLSRQPRNASVLSVHPTGMAADIRVPASAYGRRWLERTLLALEDQMVLDVTRERKPAHYHVAIFPRQYEEYVARSEAGK